MNEPNPAGGSDYVTSYTYDLLTHLTQLSMPRPTGTQTRTFVYDPTTQRLTSETHPESGTKTYAYNTDGTLATRIDAKGQKTVYSYDSYERLTMKQYYPNGTTEDPCQRVTTAYDQGTNGQGRRYTDTWGGATCAGNFTFIYTYGYTPGGLVTTKILSASRTAGNGTLAAAYTYDNESRVTSVAYPNPGTGQPSTTPYTYSFDAMGRPTGLTLNSATIVSSVQYNPADELLQWTYGGTQETLQYNSLLQLTQKGQIQYTYSANQNNGRIVSKSNDGGGGTVAYTYDSLNRLISASGTTGRGQSFDYDGFGNLTDKNVTAGYATSLHVVPDPTTNRLTTSSYSYDANGNLTYMSGAPVTNYNYDVENRLVSETGGDIYSYGPDNLRVYKKEPNGTERIFFFELTGELLAAYNPGSSFQSVLNNVYFGHRLIPPSGTFTDRLGSVNWSGGYFPYGEESSPTAEDTFKYATYYRDQTTGLDYAKHRYYSSILGRFLTPDPYKANNGGAGNPADPGSWNRYGYVGGDPVNFNDPGGTSACFDANGDNCGYPTDGMDCGDTWLTDASLVGPCEYGNDFLPGGGGNPHMTQQQWLAYIRQQLALAAAAVLASNLQRASSAAVPAFLQKTTECWAPAIPSAGSFAYTLDVTYQIESSTHAPMSGASLSGISVSEAFWAVSGNINPQDNPGTWAYGAPTGIQPNGTFTDYLSAGGLPPLTNPSGSALQTFRATGFLSNGIPIISQPLTVLGFGSPSSALYNTYGQNNVSINGFGLGTNPQTECH